VTSSGVLTGHVVAAPATLLANAQSFERSTGVLLILLNRFGATRAWLRKLPHRLCGCFLVLDPLSAESLCFSRESHSLGFVLLLLDLRLAHYVLFILEANFGRLTALSGMPWNFAREASLRATRHARKDVAFCVNLAGLAIFCGAPGKVWVG